MVEGEGGAKEGEGYKGGRQQRRLGLGKPSLLYPSAHRVRVRGLAAPRDPSEGTRTLSLSLRFNSYSRACSPRTAGINPRLGSRIRNTSKGARGSVSYSGKVLTDRWKHAKSACHKFHLQRGWRNIPRIDVDGWGP